MLSDNIMHACVHPKQPSRFIVSAIFSVVLFLSIAGLAIGAIVELQEYGEIILAIVLAVVLFFVFLAWLVSTVLYYAMLANMIMASDKNFPRTFNILQDVRRELGYQREIRMFVYESKSFNAWLVRFFLRRAIFLNSEIVEDSVSDEEIRYIVGYLAGYLTYQKRAGVLGKLIFIAEHFLIFNLVISSYHRAMVLSGDRLALMLIGGDINTAAMVMQKFFVGRTLGYSINPVGIYEQRQMVRLNVFALLARLGSYFPNAMTRFVELVEFSRTNLPADFRRFESNNPGIPKTFMRK